MIKTNLLLVMLTACLSAFANVDGPYNGVFIPAGNGLKKPLSTGSMKSWAISTWLDWRDSQSGVVAIGGFGAPDAEHRYLVIADRKLSFATGKTLFTSDAVISPGKLHQAVALFESGKLTLYLDQQKVFEQSIELEAVKAELHLAPYLVGATHFAGRLANFQVSTTAELPRGLAPNLALINFEAGSETWPLQTRAQAGYRAPQAPATLPSSAAVFSRPMVSETMNKSIAAEGEWIIEGWRMTSAPAVQASVEQLSSEDLNVDGWYPATVPGTVLTTLIDRGVYPDPDYGLNNMAIPESLNKQDYWYRATFVSQKANVGDRRTLTFYGINYLAQVWLNGKRLGQIKGAFMRGSFDVTDMLNSGARNVLLVRISPPPHPGIPQEQSIKAGPGENGGSMCLDGPTFVATEGWDWIPAVRDRNTGIWQNVTLKTTRAVQLGDVQVITSLPLPDTSRASITIKVPLHNSSNTTITGFLKADFEGVSISKQIIAQPGDSPITLSGGEFPQLNLASPRLWWPNGYGRQELYHLQLRFENSDVKAVRFGIRDISYELSLMDRAGNLRRVEIMPSHAITSEPIVDVRHESIIHSNQGWVYSLNSTAESSPAVRPLSDTRLTPFLVIRVNGVRIAARGGSWGMDDSRKRVSRERLEPFFKLHHDANLNIIRNWVGQSTEEVFFDLADEYGLLVWNDFWQSTQNYNVEPTDTQLFIDNARDTIRRFRNHPSIVLWCGRNEGVPAPALNVALDEVIREDDGTRFYAPSSNTINLQDSGPYKYFDPADYFTKLDRGFSVEVGIPSFPTLDAFKSFVPVSEQWPISDTWAYHDWHQSGNGVMEPFMKAMAAKYGAPDSLGDFERKAQLMNYVGHRAIFEGMNAWLWTANSGRMLWMTQPAWPSTVWQILSSDYDTQASYYGVKKASEAIHVQMNLPDLKVAVINNTTRALQGLKVRAQIFNIEGKLVATQEQMTDSEPISAVALLDLARSITPGLMFIKLQLNDATGTELSQNFYWYAAKDEDYNSLRQLASTATKVQTARSKSGVSVALENAGSTISLMNKLTLRNGKDGARILPAYYSDNYISLLPGEKRQIEIEYPLASARDSVQVGISGWNQPPAVINVK